MLAATALLSIAGNACGAVYTGGSDDGWGRDIMTNDVSLGGPHVTISSAANQTFQWGDAATPISMITITDATPPGISNGVSITVRIPASLAMTWDETDLNPTFGGSASGNVGGISYAGSNKRLVITVTGDFSAGDTLTISDLSFANFLAEGTSNLELDFDSDGIADALDDKTVTITNICSSGGSGDGQDSLAMTEDQFLPFAGTIFIGR